MVLVFHCYVQTAVVPAAGHTFLKALFSSTASGVDLFFVLSGFLIGGILLKQSQSEHFAGVFYVRRFFRIVPIYALLLLSLPLARLCSPLLDVQRGYYLVGRVPLWSYLVFLQNNFMAAQRDLGPWWLACTWSLAVEEQFYLVMPWLVRVFHRRSLLGLCVSSLVICPLIRLALMTQSTNPFGALYLLVARADSLLAGVLVAILLQVAWFTAWRQKHASLVTCGAAVFGACFVAVSLIPGDRHLWPFTVLPSLCAVGFAIVVLHVVTTPAAPLAGWLAHPVWVFMGGISYFVYLFHLPIQYTLHALIFSSAFINVNVAHGCTTLLGLILTLTAGALSRHFLEQPLIHFSHRFTYGAG
jgi:peptidoglycan/LPS O-acetylase OafA/YrhL